MNPFVILACQVFVLIGLIFTFASAIINTLMIIGAM